MLYITTRKQNDAYTAYKALHENCAPDGGRYVPFRLPCYSREELSALCANSFSGIVANILNIFFSLRLQNADIEFRIGKNNLKIASMNHKIVVAELWHNIDGSFAYIEKQLNTVLSGACGEPTYWVKIATKIAVLFAVYGELLNSDQIEPGQNFDISVPDDYFLTASAAIYCKKMGLPINMIICSCKGSGELWDFIHRGELNTAAVAAGLLPEMERLVQSTLGFSAVEKFRDTCERGKTFCVSEEDIPTLNRGLFCSVSGTERTKQTINSIFRSNTYLIDAKTALCFSGLQDYRSKTGESWPTLILAETTPSASSAEISNATGIPADKLSDI